MDPRDCKIRAPNDKCIETASVWRTNGWTKIYSSNASPDPAMHGVVQRPALTDRGHRIGSGHPLLAGSSSTITLACMAMSLCFILFAFHLASEHVSRLTDGPTHSFQRQTRGVPERACGYLPPGQRGYFLYTFGHGDLSPSPTGLQVSMGHHAASEGTCASSFIIRTPHSGDGPRWPASVIS